MDAINQNVLQALISYRRSPCVSIYMPMYVTGEQTQQNPVRLKKLLGEAEKLLVARGMRAAEAREFLQAAHESCANPAFWRNPSLGLAVFISHEGLKQSRLPAEFEERVVVQDRYHVRPLLPVAGSEGRYLVLAASQHRLRLFEVDKWQAVEVHVPGLPANIEGALNLDEPESTRHSHTVHQPRMKPKMGQVFHGQGGAPEHAKDEIVLFFQQVNRALQDFLRDSKLPLVFAGVDYLFPIFQKVNGYRRLLDEHVVGNPDNWSAQQVHDHVWPIALARLHRVEEQALARYQRLTGTNQASDDVRQVLAAAHDGQVEVLYVPRKGELWGAFQPGAGEVQLHAERRPTSEELLDWAVVNTLAHRGEVFALDPEMLGPLSPLAAVFRFPRPQIAQLAVGSDVPGS